MITEKTVTTYGLVALIIMVTLLVLVIFNLVPESLFLPFFAIAIVVFAVRIVLRVLLARQKGKAGAADAPQE